WHRDAPNNASPVPRRPARPQAPPFPSILDPPEPWSSSSWIYGSERGDGWTGSLHEPGGTLSWGGGRAAPPPSPSRRDAVQRLAHAARESPPVLDSDRNADEAVADLRPIEALDRQLGVRGAARVARQGLHPSEADGVSQDAQGAQKREGGRFSAAQI